VNNNVSAAPSVQKGERKRFKQTLAKERGDNQGLSNHAIKKRNAEEIFSDHGESKVAIKDFSFFTTWVDREVV
jgi:hypothetical protein